MPIHWNIEMFKLEQEITLLKKAGKQVLYIIPTTIDHAAGNHYGVVSAYAIIFEDKE